MAGLLECPRDQARQRRGWYAADDIYAETARLNGPEGVSWSDNGVIYVVEDGLRIVSVPASGGAPSRILDGIQPGALFGIEELHALPGSRGLLYARFTTDNATATIVLHRFGAGPDVDLVDGGTPRYLDSGHLLFARGSALYAAPLISKPAG